MHLINYISLLSTTCTQHNQTNSKSHIYIHTTHIYRSYQKMEEKRGKPKVDYTALDPKQAALTSVWAFAITPLVINVISSTVGQFNNEPGPCVSKAFEGLGICSEYIPK